jgi:hemerythrin superfamily protein
MNQFVQMPRKDHKEVKEILGQLKESKESAPKKRERFQKLRAESVPHMKAEESTFYPPLPAKKDSRQEQRGALEQIIQQGI